MEKLCSKCKLVPKLSNHPAYCRECRAEYARVWRAKNPGSRGRVQPYDEIKKAQLQARRDRNRGFVIESKRNKPCVDCGEVYHHSCMHYDHVRGDKRLSLSQAMHATASLVSLRDEILKCEIRCANCHSFRTWGESSKDPFYVPPAEYADEYQRLMKSLG